MANVAAVVAAPPAECGGRGGGASGEDSRPCPAPSLRWSLAARREWARVGGACGGVGGLAPRAEENGRETGRAARAADGDRPGSPLGGV